MQRPNFKVSKKLNHCRAEQNIFLLSNDTLRRARLSISPFSFWLWYFYCLDSQSRLFALSNEVEQCPACGWNCGFGNIRLSQILGWIMTGSSTRCRTVTERRRSPWQRSFTFVFGGTCRNWIFNRTFCFVGKTKGSAKKLRLKQNITEYIQYPSSTSLYLICSVFSMWIRYLKTNGSMQTLS